MPQQAHKPYSYLKKTKKLNRKPADVNFVVCLMQGTVEVLSSNDAVIMTMSGGDYFGELALLTVGKNLQSFASRFAVHLIKIMLAEVSFPTLLRKLRLIHFSRLERALI